MANNKVTTTTIEQRKVSKQYLRALKILTPDEIKVLTYVAQGLTNKEIGNEIYRSEHTVKRHRQKICKKLGLQGMGALFHWSKKHMSNYL